MAHRSLSLVASSVSLVALIAGCGGAGAPMAESAGPASYAPAQPGYGAGAYPQPTMAAPGAPMSDMAPPPPPAMAGAAEKKAVAGGVDPDDGGAPRGKPQQASGVRAGEWDDNANYREFQKYLTSEAQQAFHRVDVSGRQFLIVRDKDGKAVPHCAVKVRDGAQHETTLMTTATGRAILFPNAEGLSGANIVATATCDGSTARAAIDTSAVDGIVDLKLTTARKLTKREVDIAFVLDSTGSMSEEIAAVKTTIQKVSKAFAQESIDLHVGLVEYKDRGDEFVTKVYAMSGDLGSFSKNVAAISAGGGGDIPESMNEGVHVALSKLAWRSDAVLKTAFVIGDAPPHLDYPQDFDYAKDMKDAAHRGIQLFTVAASGMDDLGQVVFRQMAQYTGATNLFVLRGGAGPQSTGAGDPKSSCGGTQTNFTSGNLDALIVHKIKIELHGLDRDPLAIAGRGEDENAKPCAKRLVIAE